MSITIDYSALHLETLQVILVMHEKEHLQLLDSVEAQHHRLQNLQITIEQVKRAISLKEGVGGFGNQ